MTQKYSVAAYSAPVKGLASTLLARIWMDQDNLDNWVIEVTELGYKMDEQVWLDTRIFKKDGWPSYIVLECLM